MYYGNYKNWGRNSQNKVASCVCCPNAFIKHLPLEGLQKSFQLEDIINNSSYDREQYTDYLRAVYNYIQKHPKTSINM